MADVFGKQLLSNVEVVGFAELLRDLQKQFDPAPRRWFNCAQIDDILAQISTGKPSSRPPVLELTSVDSGGGKTHLLYLLTSLAVLSGKHGGRGGCVVVVDSDGVFSIDRLVQQMRHRLKDWSPTAAEATIRGILQSALHHIYVYRPQLMKSLVADVNGLRQRFIHQEHLSKDRRMMFIAVDSASAFYWQTRAEEENAALLTEVSGQPSSAALSASQAPTTYADLRLAIEACRDAFQCPVIFTSRGSGRFSRSKASNMGSSNVSRFLRPALPATIASLSTLRLMLRRMPIRKIPHGLALDELLREQTDRVRVVSKARFECIVDESGLNQQQVHALRACGEDGFHFSITQDGLIMEPKQMSIEAEDESNEQT